MGAGSAAFPLPSACGPAFPAVASLPSPGVWALAVRGDPTAPFPACPFLLSASCHLFIFRGQRVSTVTAVWEGWSLMQEGTAACTLSTPTGKWVQRRVWGWPGAAVRMARWRETQSPPHSPVSVRGSLGAAEIREGEVTEWAVPRPCLCSSPAEPGPQAGALILPDWGLGPYLAVMARPHLACPGGGLVPEWPPSILVAGWFPGEALEPRPAQPLLTASFELCSSLWASVSPPVQW